MKIVFLFLILANGLFYLWQAYIFEPANNRFPGQAPLNVPELVTLEETGTTVQTAAVNQQRTESVSAPTEEQDARDGQGDVAFVSSAEPFPDVAACFTVGPFIDDDSLQQAQQLFSRQQINYQQRTFTEPELFGYNILIPAFATREEAVEMVDVLVAKGVTDYYVMTEDEFKNAISLGLFKEHRFALEHLEGLQKKGIDAEMKTRYFERSRHWLDYVDAEGHIQQTAMQRLSPESDVQRLPRACG